MIKFDRIIAWIFIFGFICLIPNKSYVIYSDELCYLLLLIIGLIDCVVNKKWRSYSLMMMLIGIMLFYLVYSNVAVHYSSFKATLVDFVIEMKSYIAFSVVLGMKPEFNSMEKLILQGLSLVNAVISFVVLCCGNAVIDAVMAHPYIGGTTIFISAMVYLYVSIDSDGFISRKNLLVVAFLLIMGLVCGRSKYYGEVVVALYFMFVYRPGFLKRLTPGHLAVVCCMLLLVVAVGWQKFDYYFISGNVDATRFDPEVIESFARPVLYLTGGMILLDHFPFGTGLASFASSSSTDPYSGVYHEYGIDKVYGLSEAEPMFICDAYYPLLAQFGVFGLVLFVWFWVYAYSYLKTLMRTNAEKYRYQIVIGVNIVIFLLIECIGGNTLAQGPGVASMMLLGYVCGQGAKVRDGQNEEKLELQSVTKKYI